MTHIVTKTQKHTVSHRRYAYTPLEPDDFRVLVILPGEPCASLQGFLYTMPLHAALPFSAISYAWGPHEFPGMLYTPAGDIRLTKSLDGALRRFRSRTNLRVLWADAICINQGNDAEKSQQVNRMADIYHEAQEVLVWLGSATESDSLVPYMIRHLSKLDEIMEYDDWDGISQPGEELQRDVHKLFDSRATNEQYCPCCRHTFEWPNASLADAIASLLPFFKKDWFWRQWIVQEASLARFLTFYYGPHYVPFPELISAARVLRVLGARPQTEPLVDCLIEERVVPHAYHLLCQLIVRWRDEVYVSPKQQFLDALGFSIWYLQTSDDRDRVFGLRALPFARNNEWLRPDYSIHPRELWIRVAVAILTTPDDGNVSSSVLLSFAGDEMWPQFWNMPTWAPMLDVSMNADKYGVYSTESVVAWARDEPMQLQAVYDESEPDVIRIHGAVITDIAALCAASNRPDKIRGRRDGSGDGLDKVAEDVVVPWYLRCRDFAFAHSGYSPALLHETFDALLMHGQHMDKCAFDTIDKRWENILSTALARCSTLGQVVSEPIPDGKTMYRDLTPFIQRWGDQMWPERRDNRILAATKEGRIGWVPMKARVGDLVCLFKGAPFPFLLRAVEAEYFEIVGDAYVHGVVYDEFWPKYESRTRAIALV